jgi:lipoyl(octanoyl) transferase
MATEAHQGDLRTDALILRYLGRMDYGPVWEAMRDYAEHRGACDPDQIWLVEHPPVYTLGLNGRREHLIAPGSIPVIQVDRGGQVTYHGPGQAVVYLLLDLQARNLGVRALVTLIERAAIGLLAEYGLEAQARADAPGVYVGGCKVASVGLRIKRGCSYHGVSLNVDMDLSPFRGIDPCGYPGLEVTQTRELGVPLSRAEAGWALAGQLIRGLGEWPVRASSQVREIA